MQKSGSNSNNHQNFRHNRQRFFEHGPENYRGRTTATSCRTFACWEQEIDKTQVENKCRLCGKVDETVRRIVCECPMLAQMEHKRRHGWVGRKIGKYVEKLVLMQLKNSINMSQRERWKMILGRCYGMLQYKLIMQSWESAAAVGNAVVNAVLCGICGGKKKLPS